MILRVDEADDLRGLAQPAFSPGVFFQQDTWTGYFLIAAGISFTGQAVWITPLARLSRLIRRIRFLDE